MLLAISPSVLSLSPRLSFVVSYPTRLLFSNSSSPTRLLSLVFFYLVFSDSSSPPPPAKTMGMGMMRRSTSAASLKVPVRPLEALGSSSLLQYVFGLGGEAPAAARFLALLFDAPAFERGHFTRDFGRASRPQDKLPISFWPLVGYAGSYMFEDAMLRKCEALIYVYDVHQGSVADFRRIRKRISAIRDIKVAVVAFSPSGGLLDEEAEVRAHECKILAGNYGCAYFELGLDKALSPIVAEEIVSQTFDDVVGSRSDDAAPKAAAPNTPTSPITVRYFRSSLNVILMCVSPSCIPQSPTRAARKVQLGFIGDIFVGKSTLIQKLAYGQSLEQYTHTDQVQSHHKKLCFEEQNLKLQLVDTMPSIADLPAELLEKVQGWVLVFSVRNMASFRMLTQLVQVSNPVDLNCEMRKFPHFVCSAAHTRQVDAQFAHHGRGYQCR